MVWETTVAIVLVGVTALLGILSIFSLKMDCVWINIAGVASIKYHANQVGHYVFAVNLAVSADK